MSKLIFDVGCHRGEDTSYYLSQGYRVVALDAAPSMVADMEAKFASAIHAGQLRLLHCAVFERDDETVPFYISQKSVWNSLTKGVSDRRGLGEKCIQVKTKRLSTLFAEFGTPYYCKIDVEGYDALCLRTLQEASSLPQFISVETECLSEGQQPTEHQVLDTLVALHQLGYRKFKLVDQRTLSVLRPRTKFYRVETQMARWFRKGKRRRIARKLGFMITDQDRRNRVSQRQNYDFPLGSSGPFGESLKGEWLDYEAARANLLHHRADYFRMPEAISYTFWCDWHASLS